MLGWDNHSGRLPFGVHPLSLRVFRSSAQRVEKDVSTTISRQMSATTSKRMDAPTFKDPPNRVALSYVIQEVKEDERIIQQPHCSDLADLHLVIVFQWLDD